MMNQPTHSQNKAEIEQCIIIGFLYGIQSDMLSADEIQHRVAGFKHTKGFKEAKQALNDWHLQKCRSYLPDEMKHRPGLTGVDNGWNSCLKAITKRIGGE